ncbi:MAG: tRNA uridine-5-carboxymethylaminomethyl(34) synthesis GTPase MnmE [Clostridia bacterium]|nr:tRNA uridine-5-carboxymethylaminomethyl(34) synthesis GTPase MnmE [Clostridia bacterium]
MERNIAAISTALGVGGVAIIRISGESPLDIAERMFKPLGKTEVKDFEPYKMYVGEIYGEGFTDFGMCVFFKGPKSYTGEDMVEFHCHGGIAISTGILKKAFALGARPATNGEFTKRAFMNGKMSLSSCEGLIDMINGESVSGVKAGYYLYREKLTEKIKYLQSRLTYALAFLDVGIDYPEEGVVEDNTEEVIAAVEEVRGEIKKLLSGYGKGRIIKHGVKVSLIGKPNTGKSSILNRLLDYDKAIVSPVAGTTRDAVEGQIDIDGIRFNLYDTAGIHGTGDGIESVGIEMSKKLTYGSDVCIVVLDGSSPLDKDDEEVLSYSKDMTRIIVANKSDKGIKCGVNFDIAVSAVSGENIEELKRKLFDVTCGANIYTGGDMLTEERHYNSLKEAELSLSDGIEGFKAGNTPDFVALDIKSAWDSLGEVSGETASEKIIDEIFAKFCVGK